MSKSSIIISPPHISSYLIRVYSRWNSRGGFFLWAGAHIFYEVCELRISSVSVLLTVDHLYKTNYSSFLFFEQKFHEGFFAISGLNLVCYCFKPETFIYL